MALTTYNKPHPETFPLLSTYILYAPKGPYSAYGKTSRIWTVYNRPSYSFTESTSYFWYRGDTQSVRSSSYVKGKGKVYRKRGKWFGDGIQRDGSDIMIADGLRRILITDMGILDLLHLQGLSLICASTRHKVVFHTSFGSCRPSQGLDDRSYVLESVGNKLNLGSLVQMKSENSFATGGCEYERQPL